MEISWEISPFTLLRNTYSESLAFGFKVGLIDSPSTLATYPTTSTKATAIGIDATVLNQICITHERGRETAVEVRKPKVVTDGSPNGTDQSANNKSVFVSTAAGILKDNR